MLDMEDFEEFDEGALSKQEMNAESDNSTDNPSKDKAKKSRDEKRDRKKDDKSVEHVLRALNSLETTEEKLAAMCKKYADIFNDHRVLQNVAKQTEKKCAVLLREKEQLQAEHSKAILTRSRLENLCRELQRHNKAVKDESMMRIRDEEEKRKEVSAKFQATLAEITVMMQENNEKNTKLREDNIDMTDKLKKVCSQYEKREQHVEKLAKQMQLEMQLADAKLSKAKMEMAVEKEALLREKQQLLMEVAEYKSRLVEMQGTEQQLRNQIVHYNNKYDDFHKALVQSNDSIGGFKTEMDRMSKQIKKLEKETSSWRGKYEQTHARLMKMTEEKLRSDTELGALLRKMTTLQNLCRTLQNQNVFMRTQIKELKGDASGDSSLPAEVTVDLEEVKSEGASETEGQSQKTEGEPAALTESKEVPQNTEQSKVVTSAPVQSQPIATTPLISYSDQVKKPVCKKKEVSSEAKSVEGSKVQAENKVDSADNKEVIQKKIEEKPVVKSEDKAQNTDALLNKSVAQNTNKIEIKDASQNTVNQAESMEHKSQNTDSVQTKDVAQNTDVVKSQNVAQNTNKELTTPKLKGGKGKEKSQNGNKVAPQNKVTVENKNEAEKVESAVVVNKDALANTENIKPDNTQTIEAVAIESKEVQIIKSEPVEEPIIKSKESKNKDNTDLVASPKQDVTGVDSVKIAEKLPPAKPQETVVKKEAALNTNTGKPSDVAQNVAKETSDKSKDKNKEQVSPKKQPVTDTNVAQSVEPLSSPVTDKDKGRNIDPVIGKDEQNESNEAKSKGGKGKERGKNGNKVTPQKPESKTPNAVQNITPSSPVSAESKSLEPNAVINKDVATVKSAENETAKRGRSKEKRQRQNSEKVLEQKSSEETSSPLVTSDDKKSQKTDKVVGKDLSDKLQSTVKEPSEKTNDDKSKEKKQNDDKIVAENLSKDPTEKLETLSSSVLADDKTQNQETVINKDASQILNKSPPGKAKGGKEKQNEKGQPGNKVTTQKQDVSSPDSQIKEVLPSPVVVENKSSVETDKVVTSVAPSTNNTIDTPKSAAKEPNENSKGGKGKNVDKGLAQNTNTSPKEVKGNLSSPVTTEEKKTEPIVSKDVTPNKNNTQPSDKLEKSTKVAIPDISKTPAETLPSLVPCEDKNQNKETPLKPEVSTSPDAGKAQNGKAKGGKKDKGQNGNKVSPQKQEVKTADSAKAVEALSSPVTTEPIISQGTAPNSDVLPTPTKESNGKAKGGKNKDKGQTGNKVTPLKQEVKTQDSTKIVETISSPVSLENKSLDMDPLTNRDAVPNSDVPQKPVKEQNGKGKGGKNKDKGQNGNKASPQKQEAKTVDTVNKLEALSSPVTIENKSSDIDSVINRDAAPSLDVPQSQIGDPNGKGGKNKDKGQNAKKNVPQNNNKIVEKLPSLSGDEVKCEKKDGSSERATPNVNAPGKAAKGKGGKGKGQNSKPNTQEIKEDNPENTPKSAPVTGKENPADLLDGNSGKSEVLAEVESKAPVLNAELPQTKDPSQTPVTIETKDPLPLTTPPPQENPSSVEKGESITPALTGEVKPNGNPQQSKSAKHRKRAKHNKS